LKENGYKNHFEWLSDWKNARSNQCFFLGSSDETHGNQICQYDKNNLLKIKTAPVLEKQYGKYVEIPNVY
ncbi:IS200/IS605 family accessory protein TnpB-related protein, partial [Clostridium perfringens]